MGRRFVNRNASIFRRRAHGIAGTAASAPVAAPVAAPLGARFRNRNPSIFRRRTHGIAGNAASRRCDPVLHFHHTPPGVLLRTTGLDSFGQHAIQGTIVTEVEP
ncbi:MAG: hypothetical protein Kow0062_25290 [Acidobacteriota bacterium]